MTFVNSTDPFGNTSGWQITSSTGGAGLADGLYGAFSAGPLTFGLPGPSGPLAGTVTMTIHDGTGSDLTATVDFMTIQQQGNSGHVNIFSAVNVTGVSYAGVNPDLLTLAADITANREVATLSWSFPNPVSYAQLFAGGQVTGYSGVLNGGCPDGGMTAAMFGFALLGLEGLRRKLAK